MPTYSLKQGYWAVIGTALLWAILAVKMKWALQSFSLVNLSWLRFTLAFVLLSGQFFLQGRSLPRREDWLAPQTWLASLFLAANYWTYIKGLDLSTPSNAQIFIQLGPLILALAGPLMFGETWSWGKRFGPLLSIAGFSLFWFEQNHSGQNSRELGQLYIVAAALLWAVYSLLYRLQVKKGRGQEASLVIFFLAAIWLLPFVDWPDFLRAQGSDWIWPWLLGFNTYAAYTLLGVALGAISAMAVGMIITLNPILTLLLMAFFFSGSQRMGAESLGWNSWFGAILVISGACMATVSAARKGK